MAAVIFSNTSVGCNNVVGIYRRTLLILAEIEVRATQAVGQLGLLPHVGVNSTLKVAQFTPNGCGVWKREFNVRHEGIESHKNEWDLSRLNGQPSPQKRTSRFAKSGRLGVSELFLLQSQLHTLRSTDYRFSMPSAARLPFR